ncbi:MAG: DMT family transporter [Pseudohongiellaceae bacterium]
MSLTTRGVLYMLLASLFFACMAACVKVLDRLPVLELIFVRAVISASICLVGLWRAGVPPFGKRRGLLTLRGIAGAIALAQGFWLLQNAPLAAATTLTHLSPIFTTLLGIWIVKEKVAARQLLWFLLSFAGIVVMQGFDYRITPLHLLLGVGASLTMALAYNSVRKLGRTEHPLVIIFYFPLVCLPLTGLYTVLNWVEPQGSEWLWLLALGVFTQLGQYFMTKSYMVAEISKVAIVNYTEVVFAIVLGLVFFGENFNLLTYAGMALVCAGVVLNLLTRKRTPAVPPQDLALETNP